MKLLINASMTLLGIFLFAGCSQKNENEQIERIIIEKNFKPYDFKYRPIIKSNSDDSNVIIDQGVVLKAWINTYKVGTGTLIPSHYIYVRVKEPDFIPQYAIPPKFNKKKELEIENKKLPFMPSNEEIDRSDMETNENIVKYVNSYYEKHDKDAEENRVEESREFDSEIKKYLENKKQSKAEE